MFEISVWILVGMVTLVLGDNACFNRYNEGYRFTSECTSGRTGTMDLYMTEKSGTFFVKNLDLQAEQSSYSVELSVGGCAVQCDEDQFINMPRQITFGGLPGVLGTSDSYSLRGQFGAVFCDLMWRDRGFLDDEAVFSINITYEVVTKRGTQGPPIFFNVPSLLSDAEIKQLTDSKRFPTWAIILISVACGAILLAVAFTFYLYRACRHWACWSCCTRWWQRRRAAQQEATNIEAPPPAAKSKREQSAQATPKESSKKETSKKETSKVGSTMGDKSKLAEAEELQPSKLPVDSPATPDYNLPDGDLIDAKEENRRITAKDLQKGRK